MERQICLLCHHGPKQSQQGGQGMNLDPILHIHLLFCRPVALLSFCFVLLFCLQATLRLPRAWCCTDLRNRDVTPTSLETHLQTPSISSLAALQSQTTAAADTRPAFILPAYAILSPATTFRPSPRIQCRSDARELRSKSPKTLRLATTRWPLKSSI